MTDEDWRSLVQSEGSPREALAHFQRTVELDPNNAGAHCELGNCLRNQGRFAESLAAFRHGHELGSKQPGWSQPSAQWVRDGERRAALEARLPEFLEGTATPRDNAERLDLAQMCGAKKLCRAAAGFFAAAFAADAAIADDLGSWRRYNAACSAALAASGQGEDAADLDDGERARLCKQALGWLRADLSLHAKRLETGEPADRAAVQQALHDWQKDADLAGIRDAAPLAKLTTDDRNACTQLWADVDSLAKGTATPTR